MFEHFTNPREIFDYKLASALTMENDSLKLLGDMEKAAKRSDLKDLLRGHALETRRQIRNLEQCFVLLDQESKEAPSPSTKGLIREINAFVSKTDDTLVDAVVMAGALETAHHESAVYEVLVIQAKALEEWGTAELLGGNLQLETAVLEKLRVATELVARANAEAQPPSEDEPEPTIQVPPFLPPGSV